MDIHQASRGLALLFTLWSVWAVWAPPHALVSKDERAQEQTRKSGGNSRHSGWEVSLTPDRWKLLFVAAFSIQTFFQVCVFQYLYGGWQGFVHASWTAMDVLCLACMAGAAKLRRSAYRTLGKYFTYKVHFEKDQTLITDSPYTHLMHPGYTALLLHIIPFLYFIGLKFDLRILALYTAIGLVPFLRRILDEEKALEKHFGKKAFDEYRAKRWHLVPFVW